MNSETHVEYGAFLDKLKDLVENVCKRDPTLFLVGTHTLRKTAYLFAIWGFFEGVKNGEHKISSELIG